MATQLKINAQPRTESGRNAIKKIKSAGFVPAVIYGAKDPTRNLQLVEREVDTLLAHATGESVLVEVAIGAETKTALIQEIQHHPVSGKVLHIDLHAVSMDELLTAEVTVATTGEAEGVAKGGGVLELTLHTVEVECLPRDLPDAITVDISALQIGDSIHVRDLKLPKGVTITNDADLSVLSVAAPTVEEEPASPSDLPAGSQPVATEETKPADATTSSATPES